MIGNSGADGTSGVVVLGMSRSGTSAITSMFVRAGFHAGPDSELMTANHANPRGYFERREIVELNDEILGEAGATWFRPPRSLSGYTPGEGHRDRARGALERLLDEAAPAPVVLKDPRIGALLDFWLPLLAERFAPVLVIRDPLEVARSVAARDGSPLPFAIAAWELHLIGLLRRLRGAQATVAPFPAAGSPAVAERVVTDAAAPLAPDFRSRIDPAAAAAAFDRGAGRADAGPGEFTRAGQLTHPGELTHADALTPRQLALWEWLAMLEPGTQTIDAPEDLLRDRPAAWALVDAEYDRRESLQRIAVQDKLLVAEAQEVARLRSLVRREQDRMHGELDAARTALREQEERNEREVERLRKLVRSEQARLEAELNQVRAAAEAAMIRDGS